MSTPQFVSVPVPADRVEEVYRLLAQPASSESLPEGSAEVEDSELWDLEMLKRFAAGTGVANVKVGKVLDVMSQSPGEQFTIPDLSKETGYGRGELLGALSGLTRHLNAHFEGVGWMFDTVWGSENEAYYSVPEHIAEMWAQVRELRA